jgi:hypothetical protein
MMPVAITTAKYAGWKFFTTLRMIVTHRFMNASSRVAGFLFKCVIDCPDRMTVNAAGCRLDEL